MDIVLMFPGQGSQKPGMGKDLAEAYPAARRVFEEADAALGAPLSRLCFEGPAEELTLTQNAQPALLAHGAAVWAVLRDRLAPSVRAAAGHSLGEFTAYHAAGALRLDDAVRLVRTRGELMYRTGLERPGTMAALLGDIDEAHVSAICDRAAEAGLVVPANFNSPGQTVISGEVRAVERASQLAKEAGVRRIVPLHVSGAFHSPLMAPAADGLAKALGAVQFDDPEFPVFANVNAQPVTMVDQARELLLTQLTAPVRWSETVAHMARDYPGAVFVEMGPGAVLSRLVHKIAPGSHAVSCGTVAEIEHLLATLPGVGAAATA